MAARKTKTFIAVESILQKNRIGSDGISPRDSDKSLLIQFMQLHMGLGLTAEQVEILRKAPSFESITRARRKLQEKGFYHGSPEIMRKRRIKGYELELTAPKETPQGVQRRIEEN